MTRKELYSICHDEAVAYANSKQWSKRTGEEKSFLIQGYLDAMMEMRKSEITEMRKEYPKTYEECCYVLGFENTGLVFEDDYRDINPPMELWKRLGLLNQFNKLLICRDAYWKIAGEEMGLGKPWKPDYDSGVDKYGIICMSGVVQKSTPTTNWERHLNKVLDFPTAEMRDAFYENFKSEIESCKELL